MTGEYSLVYFKPASIKLQISQLFVISVDFYNMNSTGSQEFFS